LCAKKEVRRGGTKEKNQDPAMEGKEKKDEQGHRPSRSMKGKKGTRVKRGKKCSASNENVASVP